MVSNTHKPYARSALLRRLSVLWGLSAFIAGCMDPAFYEDPPEPDVVLGDVSAAADEGAAQGVLDAEGDMGAEALDAEESMDGQETEDDAPEPADECECRIGGFYRTAHRP